MDKSVDLGFLEECESWLLKNKYFPSKIGGKPAWLDLQNIPTAKELLCNICNEPCLFLCQIYAPLEDSDFAFHRTIYVFICTNSTCHIPNSSNNIKVFRNQLPRSNLFYSFDPPNESKESQEIESPIPLCIVCGCRGPSRCSKCKKVNYCCVIHQRIDWKNGHKNSCNAEEINPKSSSVDYLFPEFELIIEAEEMEKKQVNEAEQIEEYNKLLSEGKTGTLSEVPESELAQYSGETEDVNFEKFKKRNKVYQDQVLRYERNGQPLWIASNLPTEIPNCESCGEKRVFEFQIMPQMLNSLKNENIDWGILAIYTCENSCDVDSSYVKEYVYKQDIINTE